jgi:hypothetical protein
MVKQEISSEWRLKNPKGEKNPMHLGADEFVLKWIWRSQNNKVA